VSRQDYYEASFVDDNGPTDTIRVSVNGVTANP
jgi:hypothetical protein